MSESPSNSENESSKTPRVIQHPGGAVPSQEEVEARLHKDGYDSFRWYDVPGTLYPPHRHDHDECLWILKGEITFTVKDQDYVLKAGDRLYLPSQISHTTKVPASAGVTYMVGQKRR